MRLSSQGKDVTQTSVEESSDDGKAKTCTINFYRPVLLEEFIRD